MTDFLFPELEASQPAIRAFVDSAVSDTEAALCDRQFETDVATIARILEDPDNINGLRQRGRWHYNFCRDRDHPRGLWRRLPIDDTPAPDAAWQPVFDLDAFCAETSEDWHWRGCSTLFSNPDRVLLALSYQGSDQTRFLEWDTNTGAAVPGGFDIAPARSSAAWMDADTLLLSTAALPGAATRSGWQGRVIRLSRDMALEDAPTVFRVEHDDLLASAYTFALPDGSRGTTYVRTRTIGDSVSMVEIGQSARPLDAPDSTTCSHNGTRYAYVAGDAGPDPAGTLVLRSIGGTDKRVLFTPEGRRSVDEATVLFLHDHLLWIEVDTLVPALMRLDLRDPSARPVKLTLPVDAQNAWLTTHKDPDGHEGMLKLVTEGFLTPSQTWLFDGTAREPGFDLIASGTPSFDSNGMETRLHIAISEDGTEVPYHIVLPRNRAGTTPLPVLQYGYGGFSVPLSPRYLRLEGPAWLMRGGAYVMAYVRGGSEFGKIWHLAGKGEKRPNAFADFAAIADDLVARGYSTPQRIACRGVSNGGLLCGVMLTRYPEKFGAIWASVGVYDMLRYHLFPAGAGWMDEYGDPDDPAARNWLLDYSPLHNIEACDKRPYPAALIDTNESDDRVDPSHSRRFAAALRAAGQPARYHSRKGGHAGGGDTRKTAHSEALGYAFLRHALNIV